MRVMQLLTLELDDNEFHDGNVSPLAFRNLGKLIYLRLDDNDFRAIPSGLPTSLQVRHADSSSFFIIIINLFNLNSDFLIFNYRTYS